MKHPLNPNEQPVSHQPSDSNGRDPAQIRMATLEDAQAYSEFANALFAENLPTMIPRSRPAASEQILQFLSEHTGEKSALLLAEAQGQLVGTLDLTRLNRPHIDHRVVLGLSVARTFRRRGIGALLLKRGIAWVKTNPALTRIELEVLKNNAGAISLYKNFGFLVEGEKRNAVCGPDGPVNILMMGLLLEPAADRELSLAAPLLGNIVP